MIEVRTGVPVRVVEDMAVMDRDPQPQPPWPGSLPVVTSEFGGEGAQQRVQQRGRRDHGVEQDQDPIAKIAPGSNLLR